MDKGLILVNSMIPAGLSGYKLVRFSEEDGGF
jgi:hypothetical protein